MKKLILTTIFGLGISIICLAQNKIIHEYDAMDNKHYHYMKNDLLVSEDGKTGFRLSLHLNDENISYKFIVCKVAGVGSCHEKDKLTILFDDSTRVEYFMWNSFNCKGDAYFDFNSMATYELNKPIKAIRITNGRSYDSYTKVITGVDKNFFIDAFDVIKRKDIVEKK